MTPSLCSAWNRLAWLALNSTGRQLVEVQNEIQRFLGLLDLHAREHGYGEDYTPPVRENEP